MIISELIDKLETAKSINGDVEVMIQATLLQNDGDKVFDSTVENVEFQNYKNERVLRLYWQC